MLDLDPDPISAMAKDRGVRRFFLVLQGERVREICAFSNGGEESERIGEIILSYYSA